MIPRRLPASDLPSGSFGLDSRSRLVDSDSTIPTTDVPDHHVPDSLFPSSRLVDPVFDDNFVSSFTPDVPIRLAEESDSSSSSSRLGNSIFKANSVSSLGILQRNRESGGFHGSQLTGIGVFGLRNVSSELSSGGQHDSSSSDRSPLEGSVLDDGCDDRLPPLKRIRSDLEYSFSCQYR